MRRLPMSVQLGSMFFLIAILLCGVLGYAIYNYKETTNSLTKLLTFTAARAVAVRDAEDNFHSGLANLRAFLSYGESQYEKETKDNFAESLEGMIKFTDESTTPETKAEGQKVVTMLKKYVEIVDKLITAKKINDPSLPQLITEAKTYVKETEQKFDELADRQAVFLAEGVKRDTELTNNTIMVVTVLSCLVILVVIAIAFFYSRNLSSRLSRISNEIGIISKLDLTTPALVITRNDEIGDMAKSLQNMKQALQGNVSKIAFNATSLSSASEELSATVTQQLAAIDTISHTVNEIASGSTQNTESITNVSSALGQLSTESHNIESSSSEVSASVSNAVSETKHGMELLEKVVNQNSNIADSIQQINTTASSLTKGSGEIQGIIGMIHGIAEQTNLLALNAAIEAARAGEAGRGFAVVAEEVRKLAEGSAKATEEIDQIIKNMAHDIEESVKTATMATKEVEQGKVVTEATYKAFKVISEKLTSIQIGVSEISSSIKVSASDTQKIVDSAQTISAVAEETSANTETVAAAIEEQNASMHEIKSNAETLASMAEELNAIVHSFKV